MDSEFILIALGVIVFVGLMMVIGSSRQKAEFQRLVDAMRPKGTDIKYAENRKGQADFQNRRDMPAVVTAEIIAGEIGWTTERYRIHQENQRQMVSENFPGLEKEIQPDELIIRQLLNMDTGAAGNRVHTNRWSIILTDRRLLYGFREETKRDGKFLQWVASHWYADIVETKPSWSGDLGSHVEGGGGSISGWVWNGTGTVSGQQNSIKTVKHQMSCALLVTEQNGDWVNFPFNQIGSEGHVNTIRDFVNMLDRLVDMAWKRQSVENSGSKAFASGSNAKKIESLSDAGGDKSGYADDFEKRAAALEKYAALKEKGLITEEEYNQQKKKILG
jgi:hypothetical protein